MVMAYLLSKWFKALYSNVSWFCWNVIYNPRASPNLYPCIFPLQSEQVSRLVKIPGIIISSTAVRAKATRVCLQCRGCRSVISNIPIPPGLQGYALPRKCNTLVFHCLPLLERSMFATFSFLFFSCVQCSYTSTIYSVPQWSSRPCEVPSGSLFHHSRPMCVRGLPDAAAAGVPWCCAPWRDAQAHAAVLRQVQPKFQQQTAQNMQRKPLPNCLWTLKRHLKLIFTVWFAVEDSHFKRAKFCGIL